MILCLIFGFFFGGLIPFLSGRFGKIIPADPGLLLLRLFHWPRFPKVNDLVRQYQLRQKWKKLLFISLIWGIITAFLFTLSFYVLPDSVHIYACIFFWMMTVSMVIDAEYWLLPDFFTIPLLLIGLFFSYQNVQIGIENGLIGASVGYVISVLSVLLMGIFSKTPQLGGGDVKMITAIGAWMGPLALNYILILSFLLFVILNFMNLQKKGAYGPALGTAAIIVFFMMYVK